MHKLQPSRIAALEGLIAAPEQAAVGHVFGVCDMDGHPFRCLRYTEQGIEETDLPPTILIPAKLERLLYPKRLKIVYGGRGSAKTRTIVSILTERARARFERVLCLREIMKSLDDSSYQEIKDEVERREVADQFQFIQSRVRVPATRSTFSFDGLLRNVTKLKGYANATVAWVEEAENVSRASWDILFPTIRAAGSEIIVSFNPREETDATWLDLVAPYVDYMQDGIYEDDDVLVIECNHSDNPWLTDELKLERDRMARTDPDRYMWIWEGKFRKRSDVKVLNGKWVIREFEPGDDWQGPFYGADFGFAQDPSTLNRLWIHDSKLYIEYEAHGVGIELDHMADFYDAVPQSREHTISADSARPETISHIKRRGFKIEAAMKWPGSVEDGIAYLRSFTEIVIHPRCVHTIAEAHAYQYKTDKTTGLILPDIVDADNHHWDAIRYALWRYIKKPKTAAVFTRNR